MMNKALRAALVAKLGVTLQRINQRTKKLTFYVPMSNEEATYCLAHLEGIALDNYLPPQTLARVRILLRALGSDPEHPSKESSKGPHGKAQARELILAGGIRLPDPVLPEAILDDASKMATTAYPMLYVFENSMRHVIAIMMSNAFGQDWWHKGAIPEALKNTVAERKGKEAEAWRSGRVAHPIYYTDTRDLVQIVRSNWPVFSKLFRRQEWFANIVISVEKARNTVSHMNPLLRRDIDRLRANLSKWWQLIRENTAVLRSSDL
jgi:Swt1-like HEPN